MKIKTILFTFLLSALLFSGCGRNVDDNTNPSTESSPIIDSNTTPEASVENDTNNVLDPTLPGTVGNPDSQDDITEDLPQDDTTASQNMDDNNTVNDNSDANNTMLSEQEAKQIALQKVPGATEKDIQRIKLDTDDNIKEYEGEIHYDGKEYEFEIHAYDGTILEWDEEPVSELAR